MEKINVNMSPNPLDVQTIHASQNDGEARQWEFELHNNGELIDTSDVKEQLVFKTYKGGTEQLLPENGSTPTTTPILADIQYPDGLRTDQYFTYRETPTTVSNKARIKTIKGNTLVWNQLQPIPTNSSTTSNGITFTNNNDGSVTANGTATGTAIFYCNSFSLTSGHKYLFKGCPSGGTNNTYMQSIRVNSASTIIGTDVGNGDVYTANANYTDGTILLRIMSGVTLGNAKFYPQVFDLTAMGIDITDPSEFTSLFPLPYYAYNQGTLLSFMGNGIKTVGKNLVFKTIPSSTISGGGAIISTSNFQMSVACVLKGKEYVITTNDNSKKVLGFFYEEPVVGSVSYNAERVDDSSSYTFTSPITGYVAFRCLSGYSTPMLEFGSVATNYEPYTSSTLSLPISTYFPNGMKSTGNVYDELTPTKAITRVGSVDLGSLTWQLNGTRMQADIGTTFSNWNYNQVCAKYTSNEAIAVSSPSIDKIMGVYRNRILIYDSSFADPTAFKTAMNGVYLYYELATPTETSITTASLVTENAEIPLSNNDGVLIGKCTEQLSENPGFIDAKIKLSDGDGECYSNKLQLHVERSPQ